MLLRKAATDWLVLDYRMRLLAGMYCAILWHARGSSVAFLPESTLTRSLARGGRFSLVQEAIVFRRIPKPTVLFRWRHSAWLFISKDDLVSLCTECFKRLEEIYRGLHLTVEALNSVCHQLDAKSYNPRQDSGGQGRWHRSLLSGGAALGQLQCYNVQHFPSTASSEFFAISLFL